MNPTFSITNGSVTVVHEGKSHVFRSGTPQYTGIAKAIAEGRISDIKNHLTVQKSLQEWAKGKFKFDGDSFTYEGAPIHENINRRMREMATRGESPEPLFRFWERLQKNPSFRSVNQLFEFLKHGGIPIQKDGTFLAYKAVRNDFKDHHSGTFSNRPGTVNEMPRNKISDDPKLACHDGFHVGAMAYVRQFHAGSKIMVCEVDPADVVCVPYDSSQEKMRVCKYKVIGHNNGEELSNTVHLEDDDVDEENEIDTSEEGEESGNEADDEQDQEDADDEGNSKPKAKKPAPSASYSALDKMSSKDMMDQSIENLRQYAFKHMKIIGASKIPGGKAALVKRILEVRK